MIAHKRLLIEDRSKAANEGPHSGADEAFSVHVGVTDVEHSATVRDVSIEAILKTITAEPSDDWSPVDRCGVGRQLVAVGGRVCSHPLGEEE